MYTCGPTVYDYASIGNMWSYLTADILRRYLEYLGYEVRHVKNITDVGHFTGDETLEVTGEDKLEKAAKREKKDPMDIADHYTEYFLQDEKELNIERPHYQPRPTKEIADMIAIIQDLVKKGFAYETDDGIYFSVHSFSNYGKLSGNTLDAIKAGARVDVNENKKDPADFALWKKCVGENAKHLLWWGSPWGKGFPGWHIECTAMAIKYLGDTIDIHTGGEDNIFPHHECEIAQSESYTGKLFSRYWIHTRHFQIKGEKMSKSLGNVFTVLPVPDKRYRSLKEMGYHPLAYRTLKLSTHYRSKSNFTAEGMDQAQKNWIKINEFYARLSSYQPEKDAQSDSGIDAPSYLLRFESAMNDDLNTAEALAALMDLVKEGNRLMDEGGLKNPEGLLKTVDKFDRVFAILDKNLFLGEIKSIPEEIRLLAEEREDARSSKDFQKADKLRGEIEKLGYKILDSNKGYKITKFTI